MKNVYIDADSFKNPQFVSQAIRIYMAKNNNIKFLVKGSKEDLVTIASLDNVIVKENVTKEELKDFTYQLIANDNPLENFDGSTTLFRFIRKNKQITNLIVSLKDDLKKDNILPLYEEAKKLFIATSKNELKNPSVVFAKGYKTSSSLIDTLKLIPSFKGEIPLSDILTSKSELIFVDSATTYYLFNVMDSLSKANQEEPKKKEKMSASFFSKKLFTFSRAEDEIDYSSMFLYYLIEKRNNIYLFHIKRLANLTALFKILYDIDEI